MKECTGKQFQYYINMEWFLVKEYITNCKSLHREARDQQVLPVSSEGEHPLSISYISSEGNNATQPSVPGRSGEPQLNQ